MQETVLPKSRIASLFAAAPLMTVQVFPISKQKMHVPCQFINKRIILRWIDQGILYICHFLPKIHRHAALVFNGRRLLPLRMPYQQLNFRLYKIFMFYFIVFVNSICAWITNIFSSAKFNLVPKITRRFESSNTFSKCHISIRCRGKLKRKPSAIANRIRKS